MSEDRSLDRLNDGRVWAEFCDELRAAGDQIMAATPDDPFDRAEGLRYLSRLTQHFLRSTIDESDPALARLGSSSPKIGLDNPDYVYGGGRISPRFEYKLSIDRNDAHMLGLGTFSGGLGTPKGLVRDAYITDDDLDFDANGHTEVVISKAERPGNWLPMGERSNALQVRQTVLRRREQTPAQLTLARIDGGDPPAPLEPVALVGALDRVGSMVGGIVGQFIDWTDSFRAHPFEIRPIDPKFLSVAQGDPNTSYNYSYWELDDDEEFHVVLTPPSSFDYWNLQIGNHWLESLDYMNRNTHVNHETAVSEDDGTIVIVISGHDPGRPNWLDTSGHRRGALALRWVGADSEPSQPQTFVRKRSLSN